MLRQWSSQLYSQIGSLIQLYIGYGIQYLNARNDRLWKFTTTNFSSSKFFHPLTEEFSPFFIVGPGTTNCVGCHQNFILSDFSSSHRRVVSDVWPGTTSYMSYFSWCLLEHTTTTHTLQTLNNYHPQNTTHHDGEYKLLALRMPKKTHETWQWVLSSTWQSQKMYISTVF